MQGKGFGDDPRMSQSEEWLPDRSWSQRSESEKKRSLSGAARLSGNTDSQNPHLDAPMVHKHPPDRKPALTSAFPFSKKPPRAHQPEAGDHSGILPCPHGPFLWAQQLQSHMNPPPLPLLLPAEQSLQHRMRGLRNVNSRYLSSLASPPLHGSSQSLCDGHT